MQFWVASARFICKNTTFHFLTFFLGWFWNFDFFLGLKIFSLDAPVFRSLLWLTYVCDLAPNRLKSSGIGKQKMSENFGRLALTVWEIWPPKKPHILGLNLTKWTKKWNLTIFGTPFMGIIKIFKKNQIYFNESRFTLT